MDQSAKRVDLTRPTLDNRHTAVQFGRCTTGLVEPSMVQSETSRLRRIAAQPIAE
jgi:hypothetical protein